MQASGANEYQVPSEYQVQRGTSNQGDSRRPLTSRYVGYRALPHFTRKRPPRGRQRLPHQRLRGVLTCPTIPCTLVAAPKKPRPPPCRVARWGTLGRAASTRSNRDMMSHTRIYALEKRVVLALGVRPIQIVTPPNFDFRGQGLCESVNPWEEACTADVHLAQLFENL